MSSGLVGGAAWRPQLGLAYPTAQQVGVDAVGHRHGCHRYAGLHAAGHGIGFELIAVQATPPTRAGLLIGDSARVSTKS